MKTVKEVSAITGISIRTLHHYDAIGLLKPTAVTPAGYRLYDESALCRLKTILLFRELLFPLKEIGAILDSPNFDPIAALEQQIGLLELRRDHLNRLIAHARHIQQTGEMTMDFAPFDHTKMDQYTEQAKARWGKTEAWQEFQQKTQNQTPEQQTDHAKGLMEMFTRFGALRQLPPDAPEVQALVAELRQYITGHYYTCTPQMLKGLGQLYTAGDEMTRNIDNAGGEGTADLVGRAIIHYTQNL